MAHFRTLHSCYEGKCGAKGGIAQLVERLLCKQDVSGSSPLTSTNHLLRKVQQSTMFQMKESHRGLLVFQDW